MNQIMRLRRIATGTHHIADRNNGERHESAFVSLVKNHGLLWEAELLPRSYGGDNFFGKFAPKAGLELVDSLPVIARGLLRRKVTPGKAMLPPRDVPKDSRAQIKQIFDKVEGRAEPRELNLYISGYDEDADGAEGQHAPESGQPGISPEESPTR
jgi:succinate dehydrogenase / fumarate reductase iron-sulfur subunit